MVILCDWCKRPFVFLRPNRTTCSNKCRQAKYRKTKAVNRVFKTILQRMTKKQRMAAKFSNTSI